MTTSKEQRLNKKPQTSNESQDFLSEFLNSEKVSPSIGKRVEFFLPYLQGPLVLDAGSGQGTISRAASKGGFSVVSLDADKNIIKPFKLASIMTKTKGSFLLASISNLPFKDGVFDSIICSEVLEHIPHVEQALSELSRVSKKGARLCISIPGPSYLFIDVASKFFKSRHGERYAQKKRALVDLKSLGELPAIKRVLFGHINHWLTPLSISRVLAKAGFSKIIFKNSYFLSHFLSAFFLGSLAKSTETLGHWR